jgi:hypothetical protein
MEEKKLYLDQKIPHHIRPGGGEGMWTHYKAVPSPSFRKPFQTKNVERGGSPSEAGFAKQPG